MTVVLTLAGGYNLTWGILAVWFPEWTYRVGGMDEPPGKALVNVELWQCIGMIVGVWGVGYLIAARDPMRYWPVVLVGFLGKAFGPLGVLNGVLANRLSTAALWTNLFNDMIWILPFGLILLQAYRTARATATVAPPDGLTPAIQMAKPEESVP
jgi:hypothetical protein